MFRKYMYIVYMLFHLHIKDAFIYYFGCIFKSLGNQTSCETRP